MPKDLPKPHPESGIKGITCGQCQWFSSGYNNINCRTTREVEFDTQACIEYTPILEDPFHDIINDKYISSIRQILSSPRFKFDPSATLEELRKYLIDDSLLGKQMGTSQDMESLDKAMRMIISHRSRVSNIYTHVLDLRGEFEELKEHAQLWLVSKYSTYRDAKNEAIRKAAFNRIMVEAIVVEKNIDKLVSVAKYVDDKLNSNEFTIRAIMSSSEKLWFSRNK